MVGFDFDAADNTARFEYAFDRTHRFTETVVFGGRPLRAAAGPGLEGVLRLAHLAAGVSYFKAAAPDVVSVETGPLDPAERALVRDLYDKGLREFAVANGLDVPLEFDLQAPSVAARPATGDAPPPGVAVPVGGGKDSVVLVDAARRAGPLPGGAPRLVAVNSRPAMERIAAVSGLELVPIGRSISPELLRLNGEGALNGHVPITAIVSLICVAAGYVHGYDTTLMALERSADEATALVGGVPVNHQWSKSTECELALRSVLQGSVSPALAYRSGLRELGELEIARLFAGLPEYHLAFRSCNFAYRPQGPFDAWCCNCPKCRFVFLMLAPFLPPARLGEIFGRNLLEDPSQAEGFLDLCADGRKPYECVGEQRESLLAFLLLVEDPAWRDTAVVRALRGELERRFAKLGPGDGPGLLGSSEQARDRVTELVARTAGRKRG